MAEHPHPVRLAAPADADELARLLHDFNVEFDTPSPGSAVLAPRLRDLLAGEVTFAVVAGAPDAAAHGLALVTLRPNVWYDGPVAMLDELYVVPARRSRGIGSAIIDLVDATCRARGVAAIEINVDEADVDAQRFYERHGYTGYEPATGERAYFFSRELEDDRSSSAADE